MFMAIFQTFTYLEVLMVPEFLEIAGNWTWSSFSGNSSLANSLCHLTSAVLPNHR